MFKLTGKAKPNLGDYISGYMPRFVICKLITL